MMKKHDQDNEGDRDSEQPKKDRHNGLPFDGLRFDRCSAERVLAPGAVTQAAALGGCERSRKCAYEKRQR
jgi:hypothetical protein